MKVQTSDLSNEFRYVPQWWFIWWHCSWHEIGYQYEVPYSYEDEADAWGSYYNRCVAFNFISYEEAQTKLDYYRMNDLKRQKKKEIKDAVLGYKGN